MITSGKMMDRPRHRSVAVSSRRGELPVGVGGPATPRLLSLAGCSPDNLILCIMDDLWILRVSIEGRFYCNMLPTRLVLSDGGLSRNMCYRRSNQIIR